MSLLTPVRLLARLFFPILNGLAVGFVTLFLTTRINEDSFEIKAYVLASLLIGSFIGWWVQGSTAKGTQRYGCRTIATMCLVLELSIGLIVISPLAWLFFKFTPPSYQHSICCETPIDYGATKYENIHLVTQDGANISGWYVQPSTQQGKLIILIHGALSDRRGTEWHARVLIHAGYGVLLYDLRDNGESSGKLNMFNIMDVLQYDLTVVARFAKQKPEIKEIGVIGLSLGAYVTLNTGEVELNNFSALWLDGLRGENFGTLLEFQLQNDPIMARLTMPYVKLFSLFYPEAVPSKIPTFSEILPKITKPSLMIVASGLDEDEYKTNLNLRKYVKDNKQIWIIPNAWHIGGTRTNPVEYRDKLLTFFQSAFDKH